jgi:hypothetical protein
VYFVVHRLSTLRLEQFEIRCGQTMHWITPSEKDTDNATLEKRLWAVVGRASEQEQIQNLRWTRDPAIAGLPRLLSGQVNLAEN